MARKFYQTTTEYRGVSIVRTSTSRYSIFYASKIYYAAGYMTALRVVDDLLASVVID